MKLNEAFPQWITGNGLFKYLQENNVPWKDKVESRKLDILYHTRSGQKTASILIDSFVENDSLPESNKQLIANTLWAMYDIQWTKLWDTLLFEYNPIWNKDGTITEEVDRNLKGETNDTNNNTSSLTDSTTSQRDEATTEKQTSDQTVTSSNTQEQTTANQNDTSNKTFGFNSDEAVDKDSSSVTDSGSATTSSSTTDETSNEAEFDKTAEITDTTSKTSSSSSSNTGKQTNEQDEKVTTVRKEQGNIGITSTQQLINEERELWEFNYFNRVFEDIDKMLCLSIYE